MHGEKRLSIMIFRERTAITSLQGLRKVIGYACFWYVLDEAQLVNIGVLPEFRKQGAAKAILEAGIDKALENDMKTMFLEVRVSNHGAQNLYKNFGFHVDGLRKSVYELPVEDGYIMSRKL